MNNREVAEYIAKNIFEQQCLKHEMSVPQAVDYFLMLVREADNHLQRVRPTRGTRYT